MCKTLALFIKFFVKDNINTNKNKINLFDFNFLIKQFKIISLCIAITLIERFVFNKRFNFFFKLLSIKIKDL